MSRIRRFQAAIAFALLLQSTWSRTALAQAAAEAGAESDGGTPGPTAEAQAAYREVVTAAVAEFDAGRWAEARALFLRAHELWPSARTLRTLGMTAFDLGMYPRAQAELQAALEDTRRPLPDDQRAQVASLLEQTHALVGRYRVHLFPPDAELWVDAGQRPAESPLVLNVGEHALVVRAQRHAELRRSLSVQGGEDEDLALRLEPVAEPVASVPERGATPKPHVLESSGGALSSEPDRTPAFIAFGVGAAGLVVGTVSGVIAFSYKHDADPSAGYRAADISTVAFISAGAAIAVGVTLLIMASSPKTTKELTVRAPFTQAGGLRPVVGLEAVGVAGDL